MGRADRGAAKAPAREFLEKTTDDALTRLLVPSLEREIRRELTQRSEGHAVEVFARNLRGKLLAPPLRGRRVLAVDPGFRTGCKLAVLDETGNLLEDGVVYPHTPPQARRAEAKVRLEELVRKHQVQVIAIGNGTACRETEEVVSELIADLDARRHGKAPETPAAEPAPRRSHRQPRRAEPTPPARRSAEAVAAPPPEAAPASATPEAAPDVADPPDADAPGSPAAGSRRRAPSADGAAQAAPPPAPAPAPEPPRNPLLGLPDAPPDLAYVIVNEAGASVYSASPVGREEFPNFDATLRGTISIGRRLQDPLSELVKIDPQHVGVGLYQHDVSPKQLRESLDGVVESCVNSVGVDLNTASVPLLRHVSGLNQMVARDLVEYRKNNGPFQSREQLMQVNGIGEARFIQAAGFLKIGGGANPLDGTWIHPESYPIARQVLTDLGFTPEDLLEQAAARRAAREAEDRVAGGGGVAAAGRACRRWRDILDALARPGRDPREDLPPPIFKKGVLKLEDLQPGMELKGTVLNVVDFGAFIDIGLKDSGLVHISQMANRYVKSPYDVAAVGDVVTVWVLAVDKERRRVSLTMIQPGTERKPPEKKPQPPRREGPPPNRRPPQAQEGRRRRSERRRRRAPAAGRRAGRNRAGDRSTAVVRRRAATSGLPPRGVRRPTAASSSTGGRGPSAQGGEAHRRRARQGAPPAARPSNSRRPRRASRAARRPSRTCRRRPSPAPRRSAPSPNWPRSGRRRRRKRRRRPRRAPPEQARKADRRRRDGRRRAGASRESPIRFGNLPGCTHGRGSARLAQHPLQQHRVDAARGNAPCRRLPPPARIRRVPPPAPGPRPRPPRVSVKPCRRCAAATISHAVVAEMAAARAYRIRHDGRRTPGTSAAARTSPTTSSAPRAAAGRHRHSQVRRRLLSYW